MQGNKRSKDAKIHQNNDSRMQRYEDDDTKVKIQPYSDVKIQTKQDQNGKEVGGYRCRWEALQNKQQKKTKHNGKG